MDANQDTAKEIFPIRGSKYTNGMKDFRAVPQNFEPILEQIKEAEADPKDTSAQDSATSLSDPETVVASMEREKPGLSASQAEDAFAEKANPNPNPASSTPVSSTTPSATTGLVTPPANQFPTPTSSFPVAAKLPSANRPARSAPPAL